MIVAFAGWIFSLLSQQSVHVRWFLPIVTTLISTILFTSAFGIDWSLWQALFGLFLTSVWVVHGYRRSPRYAAKPYSGVWLRSVLISTAFVVGLFVVALQLIPYQHM